MLDSAIAKMYQYRLPLLWGEIEHLGKPNLTVPDLIPFDNYHYCGVEAMQICAEKLGLDSAASAHVLDIGSGVGGTARYLAWQYGCRVTGIELQPQLHQAAVALTQRTHLSQQVTLLQGNFLDGIDGSEGQFSGWLSLMVFLHISDRQTLFQQCAKVLQPQGKFYIEDYFQQNPLTKSEQIALAEHIACPYLPTRTEYLEQLRSAGFTNIHFLSVTDIWQKWVNERLEKFQARQDIYLQRHGADMVASYLHFYQTVVDLFAGGRLGGARIWGELAN